MKALCLSISAFVVCMAMFALQASSEEKAKPDGGVSQTVLNGLIARDNLPPPALPRVGSDPLPAPPPKDGADKQPGPAPQANANAASEKPVPRDRVLPPVPASVLEKWLKSGLAALKNQLTPPGLLKEKLTGKPDNPGKSQGKGKSK